MAKEIAYLARDGGTPVGKGGSIPRRLRVGIIDAALLDHGTRHPNFALMKLSGWFKRISQYVRVWKTGCISDGIHTRDLCLHVIDLGLS